MTLLPVIERELRAAARHSFTYTLRLLGVFAALAVTVMFGLDGGIRPDRGGELFAYLHRTLFLAIWILVPLLAADCISRERREGTLPLLFLTPLRPLDIVYAKGVAHGLRAFTLWLAVLPVLTICFLVGGVDWIEVSISVMINFSAICLAMAAGLAASSRARVGSRALVVAMCVAFVFLMAFFTAAGAVFGLLGGTYGPWGWMVPPVIVGGDLTLNWHGMWSQGQSIAWPWRARPRAWGTPTILQTFGLLALASLFLFLLVVRFCSWSVKRTWRANPPSARMQWFKDRLFRPVMFKQALRRWLNRQLYRNPIGWLEQRSWNGRLVVWSWFAVVVCIYSSLFSNLSLYQRGFHDSQSVLATLLAGAMAISAAGSFRRERETGVLELLLVAPLSEGEVIWARVRGLWAQFLPALALLLGVWLYSATFINGSGNLGSELLSVIGFAITFATVPVVGLYFSLARASTIAALIWTVSIQIAAPALLGEIAQVTAATWFSKPNFFHSTVWFLPFAVQMALALIFGWRLHTDLKGRRFVLA